MKTYLKNTDEEILQLYRSNHRRELIGILYSRYTDLVYGLCLKYLKDRDLAQDAVMDIFERLLDKLKTEEVEFFKSWLYMVSKNHCLMQLRKKQLEISSDLMEIGNIPHLNDSKEEIETDLKSMEECLQTLKSEQEICVRLFFLNRMSYKEIELKSEYDLKSVKSHIQNGKRNLKICMESKNG